MIEPIGHRVLVKVKVVEEKTAGGIILAAASVEKEQRGMEVGEVVSLGSTAYKAFDDGTPWVKPGDIVKFRRYEGVLEIVKEGDKEIHYRILNDDDIFCKVTEDK